MVSQQKCCKCTLTFLTSDKVRLYVYNQEKLGVSAKHIHVELFEVHGKACSSNAITVFPWIQGIKSDNFSLHKSTFTGRPRSVATLYDDVTCTQYEWIDGHFLPNTRFSKSDITPLPLELESFPTTYWTDRPLFYKFFTKLGRQHVTSSYKVITKSCNADAAVSS